MKTRQATAVEHQVEARRPLSAANRAGPGRALADLVFGRYLSRDRILGLDLMRVLAAGTILVYHGLHFGTLTALGQNPLLHRIYTFGYLAVDMFFVLSGWLLTQQILRLNTRLRDGTFTTFWVRRWLRTLPPYLVGLAVAFWLLQPAAAGPEFALHAMFLQTIWLPNLYPISWSLVTEEWFYLVLPVAVAIAGLARRPAVVVVAALAILPVPMLIRMQMLQTQDFLQVLMTPQARFEGLLIGAGLAGLSVRAPDWFIYLERHRLVLFTIGLVVMAAVLFGGRTAESSWLYRTWGLLAFSVAVGALIPLLAVTRWPALAPSAVIIAVTLLSDATYSLYLVHTLVPHPSVAGADSGLTAATWLASVVGAAVLMHLLVERPFLAVRSRFIRRQRAVHPPATAPRNA